MRNRSKSQQRAELRPKNHQKPSMQTVLPSLDKDFDKRMKAILNIPPSKLKVLKAKWKKERKERKQKVLNNF